MCLPESRGSPRDSSYLSRSVGDSSSLPFEDIYGRPPSSVLLLSKSLDTFNQDFKRSFSTSPAFVPMKTPDDLDDKFDQFNLSDECTTMGS